MCRYAKLGACACGCFFCISCQTEVSDNLHFCEKSMGAPCSWPIRSHVPQPGLLALPLRVQLRSDLGVVCGLLCSAAGAAGAAPDPASMALMAKLGKRCPKCSNFIQKDSGCHVMMCGTKAHGLVAGACMWDTLSGVRFEDTILIGLLAVLRGGVGWDRSLLCLAPRTPPNQCPVARRDMTYNTTTICD